MIASLQGVVQATGPNSLVVNVNGVGYQVFVPRNLSATAEVSGEISIFTTLVVREDQWQLFGFDSAEQQALFDLLRSVSGVGPKTALAILSTLTASDISAAVTEDDSKPFESVTGVGVKTAKLINVTLAGKLKSAPGQNSTIDADLLSALKSLGWSEKIALPVVRQVIGNSKDKNMSDLIRESLALLGK